MGISHESTKQQQQQVVELGFDHSETNSTKKWAVSGIPLRSPLKPIFTNPRRPNRDSGDVEEECSTTPTGDESRIPARLTCPPAPSKKKPSVKCINFGVGREFFSPPDLETVFIRRSEKAS